MYCWKDTIKKLRSKAIDLEKISVQVSDKEILSRIYKNLLQLNKKSNDQKWNGQSCEQILFKKEDI